MKGTFQHNGIILHYHTFGRGSECVLAFHGFTKDGTDYEVFEDFCKDTHTIYSLDLFYHGKTILPQEISSFSKKQLKSFFEAFISHLNLNSFSVIGYSMGGISALFCVESFPKSINNLYLLAPDGLKVNFWNWVVTSTVVGRKLYLYAVDHPGIVYRISKVGQYLKIFPPAMDRFLDVNFSSRSLRLRIYKVWMLYKNISVSQQNLWNLIEENQIRTKVFVGHKDPVVKPKLCNRFVVGLGELGEIHVVKAGHDLFRPHVINYFKDNFFK